MRVKTALLFASILAVLPSPAFAQTAPRQLTAAELQRLRDGIANGRANVEESQRTAVARQQELARQRAAEREQDEDYFDDVDDTPQPAPRGFADAFAHGLGVFQDEMAKKDAEQAAMQANLARIQAQADAVARERERQRQQQDAERQARARQVQLAQHERAAGQATAAAAQSQAHAQQAQLRQDVEAERARMAAQKQQAATAEQRARADAEPQTRRQAQDKLTAAETAAAERLRKAEADRTQSLQQAAANIRSSFNGHATTCAGGGKDIYYLQASHPPETGCNVRFEARCPATPAGAGTRFGQMNYVGASCMGLGDSIRIGAMRCAASEVRIVMTEADCGG